MAVRWGVKQGDCLELLRQLPDGCLDALVTDPPAGIGFMGKDWDSDKGGREAWIAWLAEVMREVYRVLKPGAHGLVWALPRTSHWTATALELAGFEVRDRVVHLFGTGFPKSLDPAKNGAPEWKGYGTALKPAAEDWWLVRKPLAGTVAANLLAHGTGALNVDGCRIATAEDLNGGAYSGSARRRDNYAPTDAKAVAALTRLRRGIGEYVAPAGRWPAHLVLSHEPECAEGACADGCAVAALDAQSGELRARGNTRPTKRPGSGFLCGAKDAFGPIDGGDSGGASRFFYCAKPSTAERERGLEAAGLPLKTAAENVDREPGSAGMNNPRAGAGRTSGRRNHHPTVKSIALMRWLVRLITPPGGLVLDPFCGSGTTGIAAVLEGAGFLGLEREPEYAEIARARIGAHLTTAGAANDDAEKPDEGTGAA